MTVYYQLDENKNPVLCTFEQFFPVGKIEDRRVASSQIGDSGISTVFLGLDHNFSKEGPPILFETLVFNGKLDGEMERCCTWDEAVAMHERMCERVRSEA